MFAVNIALGATVWRLLFKEEAPALEAYRLISEPGIENLMLEDSFGQKFCAKVDAIHGFMLEDMDKAKMANVELFLHQQRVQVLAQKAAQSDPGLRAASMMNGPRVLDPVGMPRN